MDFLKDSEAAPNMRPTGATGCGLDEPALAWRLKADVLRARGKANTLHDIEQAADYLDAADSLIHHLSSENALLREREGWKPIETAPTEGEFLAPDKHGDLIRVQRYDNPFGHENSVINAGAGRWWSPTHWMPYPASPSHKEQSNG